MVDNGLHYLCDAFIYIRMGIIFGCNIVCANCDNNKYNHRKGLFDSYYCAICIHLLHSFACDKYDLIHTIVTDSSNTKRKGN